MASTSPVANDVADSITPKPKIADIDDRLSLELVIALVGPVGSGCTTTYETMTAPATVAGELYHLTFDYGALGAGSEMLNFSLPDYAVTFSLLAVANNNLDTTFQTYSADILGNGRPLTLQFQSSGVANVDAIIDNVRLTGAPVPEPATWAMMLLGFGGIGMAMRRTRRVVALA